MKNAILRRAGFAALLSWGVGVDLSSNALAATHNTSTNKPILISQPISDSSLIELKGNIRPEATQANDRGALSDQTVLDLQLQLKRSPDQEIELKRFIDSLHDQKSANYHHWLTPKTYGEKYGLSDQDLATLTHWLEAKGFEINLVYPNKTMIDFIGTAGQVRSAFHTQLHKIDVSGEAHYANFTNPKIPAALAPAIAGVLSLHDIQPRAMNKPRSEYTYTSSSGTPYEAIVPADLATIYNLNPLYASQLTGEGQTIVLASVSDLYSDADWNTFRSTFGLDQYTAGNLKTVHPYPTGAKRNNCLDPGVSSAQAEAAIDTQWSTAAAPGANIVLSACRGLVLAVQNAINSADVTPSVMSISYGECESYNGESGNATFASMYQQAVAQGISVFVSSGDEGAASCDAGASSATHGISVSGLTATPYNVSVGGTDFGDTYARQVSSYWSTTNSSTFGSAMSYIPEIPWNDSCASDLITTFQGYADPFGVEGFCNVPAGARYISTASGSGGPSGCATGTPATSGLTDGTCVGAPQPDWQTGVYGMPSNGVRNIPDVSLFAANGVWGHYYVLCDTDHGGTCPTDNPGAWSGYGGTSISSPIMAGIQAIANQASGSLQGNPNYTYYALANKEFGSSGSAICDSQLGAKIDASCVFYDVTLGDMDVNCTGSVDCYLPEATYGVLSTTSDSYDPAYKTASGWDFATGLGTVNAYALVMNFAPSLSASTSAISFGTQVIGTTSAAQLVTLTNTGGSTVTFTSITPAADFPETTTCGSSLAAGASCTISVTFAPTAATAYSETLTIASNALNSPATVALTGTGTTPPAVLTVSPSSLSFGNVDTGTTSSAMMVTLSNTGGSTLALTAITPAKDFPLTSTCPASLTAGASCTVSVKFAPTSATSYSESMTITTDASETASTVALTGTGVTPASANSSSGGGAIPLELLMLGALGAGLSRRRKAHA